MLITFMSAVVLAGLVNDLLSFLLNIPVTQYSVHRLHPTFLLYIGNPILVIFSLYMLLGYCAAQIFEGLHLLQGAVAIFIVFRIWSELPIIMTCV